MGNPFEARKRNVEVVATEDVVVTQVEAPEVLPEAPEAVEAEAVPEGKVSEILEWVGEDVERAVEALTAEEAGARRSTLIKALEEIIAAA